MLHYKLTKYDSLTDVKLDINLIKLACLMLSCLINNNIFQCYFGDLIYLFRHGLNGNVS